MRQLSSVVLAVALFGVGCSHAEKKSTPESEIKIPAVAPAEKAKSESSKTFSGGTKVECSVKGDDRILESRAKDKGCELGYTKAGKEGVVASSAHGTSYCEKALEKLRDKLKGSGYTCK